MAIPTLSKLVVTGTTGFLGGVIARYFADAGCRVLCIDRQVSHHPDVLSWASPSFDETIASFSPDAIIHAAGGASVPRSIEQPLQDFAAGPALVMRLLDSLRRRAPSARVIFLSSAAVYGQPVRLPIGEDFDCEPLSPYGFHKWMSEIVCREYAALHGLPVASARIFSAYGPGLRKQVIWDLLRKASASWQDGALQGTGLETRDFIHAYDIARAIECLLLRAPLKGECYNLASGTEITIREAVDLVARYLRVKEQPVFTGKVPSGTPTHWRADIGAIRSLGFEPRISIDEGIAETAAWFRALNR